MSRFSFRPIKLVDTTASERPGYPNFSAYTLDVISSELPCGTSWLASTLLECDCPIWNPWNVDMSLEWKYLGGTAYEYFYPGNPWSRVLPGLVTGRKFDFRTILVPRFSHATPGHWPLAERLVIFVRDPRDALYSAWRRSQKLQPDIAPFVDWLQHIDPTWGVPRCAAYLLHLATWKHYAELSNTPHLVIRFEDVKADARAEFRRVQDFLPDALNSLPEPQIERALSMSTFEAVKTVEDQMLADGTFDRRMNNAGVPFEYRTHFDAAMHAAIGGGGRAIYEWLRYEQPAQEAAPREPLQPTLHSVSADTMPLTMQAVTAATTMYQNR